MTTPLEVARAFVDRINAHDVDGLCALMTEDHLLMDGSGASVSGRASVARAWLGYFRMIPDYFIHLEHVMSAGRVVALLGRAGGTLSVGDGLDPADRCEIPAAWQAVIEGDRVAHWRVYADNDPLRRIMQRVHGEERPA